MAYKIEEYREQWEECENTGDMINNLYHGWTAEYLGDNNEFATEEEAELAIEDVKENLGWFKNGRKTRVVEIN